MASSNIRDSTTKNNVKSSSREDKQDRKFCVLLYPDSEQYEYTNVLSIVETVHQFAYIVHDQDKDDEGNFKKKHCHIVLRYANPRSVKTVANQLGIESQYIQACSSFKAALRYLVHRTPDSFDKHQYGIDEVITNVNTFGYDVGECNECTALTLIYELLDSGKYTLPQLGRYLATKYGDPAIYSAFRRNYSILKAYEDSIRAENNYIAFRQTYYTPRVTVDMETVNALLAKGKEN